MEHKQLVSIVSRKQYKEPAFLRDVETTKKFFQGIGNLPIDSKTFKVLRVLLRFFQFPMMILTRPFFQRIEEGKMKYFKEFDVDLIKLGSISKAIMGVRDFPLLAYFLKSGYDNAAIAETLSSMQKNPKMEAFMEFISKIDQGIDRLSSNNIHKQLETARVLANQITNYKDTREINILEQLCLEQYSKILEERVDELNKLAPPEPILPKAYKKKDSDKILINGQPSVTDSEQASSFLCCRTYFYNNEIIEEPQSLTQQYKKYDFPYTKFLGGILMKTICGFLNGNGGIIYIGIQEAKETLKRVIMGSFYSESLKEDVLKYFRVICQRISPQIVNNQLYKLEYVPIRDLSPRHEFIPGKYIIRLKIQKGQRNQLYTYEDYDRQQFFAFRTANEVLVRKIGQNVLEMYRNRLLVPDNSVAYINHPGPCQPPDNGKPIYDNNGNKYNYHSNSYSYGHQNNNYNNNYNNNNNYNHNSNSYDRANNNSNSNNQNWKRKPAENPQTATKTQPVKTPAKQTYHNDNFFFICDKDPKEVLAGMVITTVITREKSKYIITPKSKDDQANIEKKSQTWKNINIIKAGMILKVNEESFNVVFDIFNERKILMVVLDREHYKFQKMCELIDAIEILNDMSIPYRFL